MNKVLIGYAGNKGIAQMTREQARMLTHINLAFGHVVDGLLNVDGLSALDDLDRIRGYHPDIKIVLSVGGWGAGGFSEMARTKEGRERFIASCVSVVNKHALDGIDMDWEYPCSSSAGIESHPSDRENFTYLMQGLRNAFPDGIVSIAAGAGHYFVRDTQMNLVAKACDYIQLMTYDMRSGFDHQAGHHTGLYASLGDEDGMTVERAVDLFHKAGVPKEKIVIGAAFYSRHWQGVPDINLGLLQQAQTVGNYGPSYDKLVSDYINKNGWIAHWDEVAKAPWLWNGTELISYDNPESLKWKCDYLKDQGLLGIMYWEHSSDSTGELLTTLAQNLGRAKS